MKLSFFNFFRRKKQKKATEGPSFPQWNRPSGRRNRQSLDNDHAFSASAAHEHSRRILTLERDRGALKRGQRRSRVLCLAMVLFVGAIILQLVNLQFVQKDFLAHWALNQISGENLEIVPRGSIVDRNGEELAVSVVSRSLAVNPQELVDDPDRWPKGQMPVRDVRQVAANRLSPILQMPASKLMELFTDKQHMFFWVKPWIPMLLRKSLRCWTKKRSLDSILLRKVNGIIPKITLQRKSSDLLESMIKDLRAWKLPWILICAASRKSRPITRMPRATSLDPPV